MDEQNKLITNIRCLAEEFSLGKYENYISLGYYCGVARGLEKLGLRAASSPFDWCISEFSGVIKAIGSYFEGFKDYENLSQSTEFRNHYKDENYDVFFFHGFSQYMPLKAQYESIKVKYQRRIDRFLDNIQKPTLFIRYISNEDIIGGGTALEWIEKNDEYIQNVVGSFNPSNRVLYLAGEGLSSEKIMIFPVSIPEGLFTVDDPIAVSEMLMSYLNQVFFQGRKENIAAYTAKQKKKNSIVRRMIGKIQEVYKKLKKSMSMINNILFLEDN